MAEAYVKQSGIYVIRNSISGSRYIGPSVDLRKRWQVHRRSLERGTHANQRLQRAWQKHGAEAFCFEVLELLPAEALLAAEQAHIDAALLNMDCYNLCLTAGSILGVKRSAVTRAKMAASATGFTHTEESRLKMSVAKRVSRRPCSEETKRKLSEIHRGKSYHPISDEQKRKTAEFWRENPDLKRAVYAKVSGKNTGSKRSQETRARMSEAQRRRFASQRSASD